jgi:hypothetical protein
MHVQVVSRVILTIQNSAVNNVQNIITLQKVITNSSVGQHRPPTNAKAGSGAMYD